MALLKVGDSAPKFTAKDQDGNTIELSHFEGKKIVLYFYPKDDTPGCTAEACSLRDNYAELLNKGIVIIGVSADSQGSHKKFINKYDLPFPIIADEDKSVIKSYRVWGEKKMYGKSYEGILRTTYIISENGKIDHIIEKVDTKNHSKQVLETISK